MFGIEMHHSKKYVIDNDNIRTDLLEEISVC